MREKMKTSSAGTEEVKAHGCVRARMRQKVLFWAGILMLITLVTGWPLTRRLAWTLVGIWFGDYLAERIG